MKLRNILVEWYEETGYEPELLAYEPFDEEIVPVYRFGEELFYLVSDYELWTPGFEPDMDIDLDWFEFVQYELEVA